MFYCWVCGSVLRQELQSLKIQELQALKRQKLQDDKLDLLLLIYK
jgi:hypothetical protein